MRIDPRIAVAGKMFRRGKSTVLFDTAYIGVDEHSDLLGIFPKGANVDNGVIWVAVYVGDRCENPVDADCPCLGRSNASDRICVLGATGGRHGHGMRKRRAILEPHGCTAFEIGRKQQRNARGFLQEINHRGCRIRLTALDSEGTSTRA